jgi:hypothetical protein
VPLRGPSGKVLILSPHVMTAALVGWYVELAKLEPTFAAPGEHPDEALARIRPVLVVLIDAELSDAISDLLVVRAARKGAGLALFTGRSHDEPVRAWAERRGVPFFKLPIDLEAFGRMLDQAARKVAGEPVLTDAPTTETAVDGTLVLREPTGQLWYVYDRRSSNRTLRAPSESGDYRAFVEWDGTERRCRLSTEDAASRDPDALVAQLARSIPV